jgi:hypothetical protein
MVDGFPYKEEVGGSSPSAPTKSIGDCQFPIADLTLLRKTQSAIGNRKAAMLFAES